MDGMKSRLDALKPDLRDAVLSIAAIAKEVGGRAMMVGGAVRDMAIGAADVKDVDLEVFGVEPHRLRDAISRRFAFDECGVSFGVLKIKHIDIDVALPRRESKYGIGHRGFLVDSDPFMSVKDAASRRDFTVNAMYCDPLTGEVEDPYGGMDDLRGGILRHVSDKFAEDPLRVLRGMQFVARFGLRTASETVDVCRRMSIENLPPERIFGEFHKMLVKGREIGAGLEFLRETGWVRHFPELNALIGCPQDPEWHSEGSVWNHTRLCLDAFAKSRTGDSSEDLIVGLAVLCHDFGKPLTTRYEDGHLRSRGHDEAGVAPTLSFLRGLTNEERILREVPPLVKCHMQPFALYRANAGDGAIRRLALRVVRIDRLIRVARADMEGSVPVAQPTSQADDGLGWLAAQAERLRIAAAAPKPLLLGRHLIDMGYAPSEKFGRWLAMAFEAQMDGRFSDVDGAKAYFRDSIAAADSPCVSLPAEAGVLNTDDISIVGQEIP